MAQDSTVLPDSNGVTFLANANKALATLNSNNAGDTEPTNEVVKGKTWFDGLLNKMKFRNSANDGWKTVVTEDTLSGVMASSIHAAISEEPGDTDEFGFYDSLTGLLRRVSLSGFAAKLKTYFDTYYDAKTLLVEYTVTGAAVTSIDISGLDINTHKSYRVEFESPLSPVSSAYLYVFFNNVNTLTHYYCQRTNSSGGAISTATYNSPNIGGLSNTAPILASLDIRLANGFVNWFAKTKNSNISFDMSAGWMTASTVQNVTSISLASGVAGAIPVGAKIRIYRGDV
ncbi:MAG: hypothetical protein AB1763_04800 [Campylobacterota bacterium]